MEPLESIYESTAEKERNTIHGQPYRTNQLVFPNPKIKPDMIKSTHYVWGGKRIMRPVMTVGRNKKHPVVIKEQSQFSPKSQSLIVQGYQSQLQPDRTQEFVYGCPLHSLQQLTIQSPLTPYPLTPLSPGTYRNLPPPIRRKPSLLEPFDYKNSPTYQVLIEEEGNSSAYSVPETLQLQPLSNTNTTKDVMISAEVQGCENKLQPDQTQEFVYGCPLHSLEKLTIQSPMTPFPLTPLSPGTYRNLPPPIRRKPSLLEPFDYQNSPTYQVLIEEEKNASAYFVPETPQPQPMSNTNSTKNVNSAEVQGGRIRQSRSFNRLASLVM